jgi:predicted DsbA family dithiol-disulfide isomerase
MSYNSRLAQELAKWAEEKGKGDAFHGAVFRAYFVERKNIALIDELTRLAEAIGLPAEEAKVVLGQRKFSKAVDQDWSEALNLGISAVPTFLINRRMAVGAQPYEVLEQFVESCGVKRRKG